MARWRKKVGIVSRNSRRIRNVGHNSDGKDDDDGHKEARDQSLAYAETGPSSYLALRRAIYSCRVALFANLFPLLFARTNQPTNERRKALSHSCCNVDRESDKSGTGKYIRRDLRRDFEESSCIQEESCAPVLAWPSPPVHYGWLEFFFGGGFWRRINFFFLWNFNRYLRRRSDGLFREGFGKAGNVRASSLMGLNRRDVKAWWYNEVPLPWYIPFLW